MVILGVEQTVNKDNPCVVDTVSNFASGEAGFDGIVADGGQRKITTGVIGCPKVYGVNVGKSNAMSVKQAMIRHFPLLENINTKNQTPC